MSSDLEKLLVLHELDLSIREFQINLEEVAFEHRRIEDQWQELSHGYDEAKECFKYIRKDRYQLIKELEKSQKNCKKHTPNLLKINNEDLYSSVLREMNDLRRKVSHFETEILALMKELDAVKKQEKDIRGQLNALTKTRQIVMGDLPEALRRIYERIKSHNSSALAEVVSNCCQACGMIIPYIVLKMVSEGEPITMCESCGRVLYYNSVKASQSTKASA